MMRFVDRFADFFSYTSQTYSVGQWLSVLAGLSFLTYVLIIFGGRAR